MTNKKFDQKLLADILVYAINIGFIDVDKYDEICQGDDDEIARLTKQDIIKLANQTLSTETLNNYPELEIKKPDLFSKLNDATIEAKNTLENKEYILHQICINIMEEFSTLQLVKIESVEHSIIKIMCLQNQVENSTYIVINDKEQLKQNIQDFLNKIETNSK